MKSAQSPPRAAGKPVLADRSLVSSSEAVELARLFKLLANDTRLRLLHVLEREGEICVGDLADQLGLTAQAVSNQLQRLVDRRIVSARREGSRIFYRVADPCVIGLMDLGWCLMEETAPAKPVTRRRAVKV